MAKYYVTSGQHQFVVSANDAQAAALWLVNAQMQPNVSGDVDRKNSELQCDFLNNGLEKFDCMIQVSQIGFANDDAGEFDTGEIYETWRTLSLALQRLLDQLG